MSTKVNLYFQTSLDSGLLEKGVRLEVIRLMGEVEFEKEDNEWTNPYPAIVDTGAPVSLLPLEIWQECKSRIFVNHSVRGVVPKQECNLPVQVGEVILRLVDEKIATDRFSIMAYLAPTNKVPFCLRTFPNGRNNDHRHSRRCSSFRQFYRRERRGHRVGKMGDVGAERASA